MRHRLPSLLVAALTVVALMAAGCASSSDAADEPDQPRPSALIGAWNVEADDVPAGTTLRIGDPSEESFLGKAVLDLDYCAVNLIVGVARPDLIALDWTGGLGTVCDRDEFDQAIESGAGVLSATTFGTNMDGALVLKDGTGATVATLTPASTLRPVDGIDPQRLTIPTASAEGRATWDRVLVVPQDLTPATKESMIGNWAPQRARNDRARLTFNDDGSFTGSDGCNGVWGRWSMGDDDGAMVTTPSRPSTLIGCNNSGVPATVYSARFAGFDGEVLVLTDVFGDELSRFVPAAPTTTTTPATPSR